MEGGGLAEQGADKVPEEQNIQEGEGLAEKEAEKVPKEQSVQVKRSRCTFKRKAAAKKSEEPPVKRQRRRIPKLQCSAPSHAK